MDDGGALTFGKPIVAVAPGRVVFVLANVLDGTPSQTTRDESWGPQGGLGNVVTLEHVIDGRRFYSSYFHLKHDALTQDLHARWQASLTGGPPVTLDAGEMLGFAGRTGSRTGDHVHLNLGTTLGPLTIEGTDYPNYQIAQGPIGDPILDMVRFADSPRADGSLRRGDTFASGDPLALDGATGTNLAPSVAAEQVIWLTINDPIAASAFVSVKDPNGLSDIQFVRFWDATPGSDGGFLTLDGVRISGTEVSVAATELGRIAYSAGSQAGSNKILVEARDRRGLESNEVIIEFRVGEATADQRPPAIVPTGSPVIQAGTSVRLDSLVAISDPNGLGDIRAIRLLDPGGAAGGFVQGGAKFRDPVGDGRVTPANDGDGHYVFFGFNEPNPDLGGSFHLGVDWNGEDGGDTDLGDAVYAAANGVVVAVVSNQTNATSGFGNYVVLRHDLPEPVVFNGETITRINTLYAHLNAVEALGQTVTIGQKIGTIGESGNAEGAHLHFEMTTGTKLPIADDGYNPNGAPPEWIDPVAFIAQNRGGQLGADSGWLPFSARDSISYVASQTIGDDKVSVLVRDAAGQQARADIVLQVRPERGQATAERMAFSEVPVGDESFLGLQEWERLVASGTELVLSVQEGLELAGQWNAQQLAEAQARIGMRVFQTDYRIAELEYNSQLLAGVEAVASYATALRNVLDGGDPADEIYTASRDTLINIASGYVGSATFALGAKTLVAAGLMSGGAPVILLGLGSAAVAFGAAHVMETYFPETADGLVDVVSSVPESFSKVFRALNPFYNGEGGGEASDGANALLAGSAWSFDVDTGHLRSIEAHDPAGWDFTLARFGVAGDLPAGLELLGDRTGGVVHDLLVGSPNGDRIDGLFGDDILSGLDGGDSLHGAGGADTLVGGSGANTLAGGHADDLLIVDTADDLVIELPGQGADTVMAEVSFALRNNIETLVLGALAGAGTGNNQSNRIIGNDGGNTLTGLGGADTLEGSLGDDTYRVDALDLVVELPGGGLDLALAARSFSIEAFGEVENLTFTGAEAANGAGNAGANLIIGNTAANRLEGQAGNDSLNGGLGNDILRGGEGADSLFSGGGSDRLEGGAGDDLYRVIEAGTQVIEGVDAGNDHVFSIVTFVLPNHIENLTLLGGNAIDGTGNALANVIVGNGFANLLDGMGGADSLVGGNGNDTMIGGASADTIAASNGADIFRYAFAHHGPDLILDYNVVQDTIEVSAAGFGGGLVEGMSLGATGRFVANTTGAPSAATDTGQFIYRADTATLLFDADGVGPMAARALLTLVTAPAGFGASEIVVIA